MNRQACSREIWYQIMKRLITQFMKFGLVGGIAFVIDYGLLWVLHERVGIDSIVANTLSFSASVIFNYIASMKYVFDSREDMSKTREVITFITLSLIGLLINDSIIAIAEKRLGIHLMIAKIFATVVVMVWNFCSRKILLEKKPNDDIITTN